MLGAIAIIPSAPVLVPELAGAAVAEVADLRAAVIAAAAALPPRWVALGVGLADAVVSPAHVGTFAGFGADVTVRLGPMSRGDRQRGEAGRSGSPPMSRGDRQRGEAGRSGSPPMSCGDRQRGDLPLCAVFAAWVRGQAAPGARAEVRVYAQDHTVDAALAQGRQLRADIDRTAEPTGVLVVADGANTLTAAAPGGHHPEDVEVQLALDDALAAGDTAALATLPDQVVGRVAYQVLAGLAGPGPRSVEELYRGAPYGVGYFAGVWQP